MNCVYCGEPITVESREHIIQNAIGGLEESTDICCAKCNNYISKYIDKPFVTTFNPIIARINNFAKTNNKKSSPSYSGKAIYNGSEYSVVFKNGQVVACPELSQKLHCDISKLDFEIVSYDFIIDNKTFIKGVSKIAFNYALSKGMPLDAIKDGLIIVKDEDKIANISFKYPVIPFVPLNPMDNYIELKTSLLLYHNLILFSQDNNLWCYVDLFNTFQYYVIRQGDFFQVVNQQGEKSEFVLQDEQDELHKMLFGLENLDILHNLLGCFYVDQEKGWTLLNRGVVIGSNRFNVEELLRGLANRDCTELQKEIRKVENELQKYKKVLDIAEYRQQLYAEQGTLVYDDYDESIQKELDNLYIQKEIYEKELKSIKSSYDQNRSFKNYIEKMKLSVVNSDGTETPVNAKTIKNFAEINELLKARQRIVAAEIAAINRKIARLDVITEDNQLRFVATNDILKEFDKKIAAFEVDYKTIKDIIDALEKKRTSLKKQLTISTKQNNKHLEAMYKSIESYAKELSLEKHINLRTDFIFTHNLKELSGAILHKIVFAFKLGYILEVEKQLGFKLPIILDSPSGKEVDPKNIEKMFEILRRDFQNNQIIVASIHEYQSFDNKKIHIIKERLIDTLAENN